MTLLLPVSLCPLETSLVEWKLEPFKFLISHLTALETSLVEWKLFFAEGGRGVFCLLGNFLSGMETSPVRSGAVRRPEALETSLVEWKLPPKAKFSIPPADLGNFLSGMETVAVLNVLRSYRALETSLVEWKHRRQGVEKPEPSGPWKLP